MSTLSAYQAKLTFAVGTAETNLLTTDKRNDAINEAIRTIVKQYPIPQYTVPVTLTFTSGVADLPTDCLLPYQLYDSTQQVVYDLVDFDKFRSNISNTYNIYYDTSKEKIQIYPTTATSLIFNYLQIPAVLAGAADTTRLNVWWDDAVAQEAARRLFVATQSPMAENQTEIARKSLAEAWQMERQRLQGYQDQRLQSVFERRSFITSGENIRS